MPEITTNDGVEIHYKAWGSGQPIVFSHGWPLSSDDWDNQMLFFLNQGYRVVAHDRRGHGRSAQVADGHDLDHYAEDLAAVVEHLDRQSEAMIANWWRQGMTGDAKAHYDGIVAFSQTDFRADLKKITVPVLVMHSKDDQIVPYEVAGSLSAKLLPDGTLKTYTDFPHGMITTHAETVNADVLQFIRS